MRVLINQGLSISALQSGKKYHLDLGRTFQNTLAELVLDESSVRFKDTDGTLLTEAQASDELKADVTASRLKALNRAGLKQLFARCLDAVDRRSRGHVDIWAHGMNPVSATAVHLKIGITDEGKCEYQETSVNSIHVIFDPEEADEAREAMNVGSDQIHAMVKERRKQVLDYLLNYSREELLAKRGEICT